MKISMYTEGFKVDSDGQLHINVDGNEILGNFSVGDLLGYFDENDFLEVMDDAYIIEYLKDNNYDVKDLEE